MRFGEGHLREPDDGMAGVGDLYLELTSLVLQNLVVVVVVVVVPALFFSARTKGVLGLGVSTLLCFPDPFPDSHTSIHSTPITPH